MNSLRNIWHLGIKELRSLVRDPILLGLILYSFTLGIYVAATAMPETLNKAPIAIVDEDHGSTARELGHPAPIDDGADERRKRAVFAVTSFRGGSQSQAERCQAALGGESIPSAREVVTLVKDRCCMLLRCYAEQC